MLPKPKGQSLIVIAIALAVLVLAGILIGKLIARSVLDGPQFAQVTAGDAFVYPDGDGVVLLVLSQGRFTFDEPLLDGCYQLYPPVSGARYGYAAYAGERCDGR